MKLRGRQGPGQGWTRALTSAFQQGSLETHLDHHAHPDLVPASLTWLPSGWPNHNSESTFVTNDKCESNDRKENAVTKPKAAMDGWDSG